MFNRSSKVRRNCAIAAGLCDPIILHSEDYALWLNIARFHRIARINSVQALYRRVEVAAREVICKARTNYSDQAFYVFCRALQTRSLEFIPHFWWAVCHSPPAVAQRTAK